MSKKLGESIKIAAGINPASLSAGSSNGLTIDRLGYLDAKVHLKAGAATGTPSAQGVSLKMQTGDASDGSDMADVAGDTIAALTANNAEANLNIDLSGYKRYLRVVATVTFTGGTTPAIPAAATVALGGARNIPAT